MFSRFVYNKRLTRKDEESSENEPRAVSTAIKLILLFTQVNDVYKKKRNYVRVLPGNQVFVNELA